MRREKAIGLSGIIVLAVTIILYLLMSSHRNLLSYVTFAMILLSETILFAGLIAIEKWANRTSQIILRAGCGTALVIYTVVSLVISLIYMITDVQSIKVFIFLQVVLLAILAILEIALFTVAINVKKDEDKRK